ncbi:ABC transporter ATP-binding protein [Micromonospora vinacea]|uniref:ABC transporter ATP-binding protein n=1 Tax=Micromonospora vinacea TaxID=709878 RepID=UPI00344B404E
MNLAVPPVVLFEDVARSHSGPPVVHALRACSVRVSAGEYVAIVGPSGSGKSTFLNIVGLLDRPTAGRYELDGLDVGSLKEPSRTSLRGHAIGFVFQEFHLLPYRTAVENVAIGQLYLGVSRSDRLEAAELALAQVGLAHRRDALPTTLSGGERQRVAIARALIARPRLLLCDEPTGNLDTENAARVLALLDALNQEGMTILMITHDLAVAAGAQRVLRLKDGSLDPS